MSSRLLTILAYLAGFGIAAQAPSAEILARVLSKDGAGELTLTREKIVYRVNSPKLVIRLSVRDVKDVVRKDDVLIVEIVDVGMHSDPLTVQVSDLEAADHFVKAFHDLRRIPVTAYCLRELPIRCCERSRGLTIARAPCGADQPRVHFDRTTHRNAGLAVPSSLLSSVLGVTPRAGAENADRLAADPTQDLRAGALA